MINNNSASKIKPGTRVIAIDLSTADVTLPVPCRAFYVGNGGNVSITPAENDTPVVIISDSFQYHTLEVKTFLRVNTTATGILAIY
jgi:hypothetical protein